jgi:anti-sigma B factor antagonist
MPDVLAVPDSIARQADPPPPWFECSRTDGSLDASWVRVAGELDIATAPQLERTLPESQSQTRLVVLNLRELAFMDSCGVHAIVNASIRARQIGGRLVVLPGRPNVDRMFVLAGSSEDVEVVEVSSLVAPIRAPV